MSDKLPWFPLYVADFLTDERVLAMSYQQIGMYTVLLCHQWQHGSIPADPSRAQAMLKLGSSQVGDDEEPASLARVMAECFSPHPTLPDRLINLKLFGIAEQQREKQQRLSEGGRRGGLASSQAQATVKPGSTNKSQSKRKKTTTTGEGSLAFVTAWELYPKRPGNNRAKAWEQWSARLAQGETEEAMLAGARAYAAYCAARKTEPEFVKMASTFFGPKRHFLDDYPLTGLARPKLERDADFLAKRGYVTPKAS